MEKEGKNSTKENDFYLSIIDSLKTTSNLSEIRKKLNISKQNFNYYIRKLKKNGFIEQKGRGWYELSEKSKNPTNHGFFLKKDSIRGHAYVWTINLPKKIKDWDNRTEILKNKNINFKLVGAKENTPRIKVLGRKVWLCNDNIRIYDLKNQSYYGENAIESRKSAFNEFLLILGALEGKLGIFLRPLDFSWKKEHYALIKNDLAIEHNRKGEILRISDDFGEWLIIDDSLGEGGELENIGKKSFTTNVFMKNWWNDNKKHNFEVTPTFLLNTFGKIAENQARSEIQLHEFSKQIESHLKLIQEYRKENILWRKNKEKEIKKAFENKDQTKLGDFLDGY